MDNKIIPVAYTHYLGKMTKEEQRETYDNLPEEYSLYPIYLDDDKEPYFSLMVGISGTEMRDIDKDVIFYGIKVCQILSSNIDCDTNITRELYEDEIKSIASKYLNPDVAPWVNNCHVTYMKVYSERVSDSGIVTVYQTKVEFRIAQYPDITFKIVYI